MWFPWFKKLRQDAQSTKEELHQEICSIGDAAHAREQKQAEIGAAIVSAIGKIADATPDHESTQRKNEYRLQRATLRATVVGVIFAGIAAVGALWYAHIAAQQRDQMVTANHATRCATLVSAQSSAETAYYSREEERAWVEVWIPETTSLTLENPGKTVAREVRLSVHTTGGEINFGPMTIAPYTYIPVPFVFGVGAPPRSRLKATVTYVDVFNVGHWANFCYAIGEKGQMSPCRTGNEEDHNLENPPNSALPEECKQSSSLAF